MKDLQKTLDAKIRLLNWIELELGKKQKKKSKKGLKKAWIEYNAQIKLLRFLLS